MAAEDSVELRKLIRSTSGWILVLVWTVGALLRFFQLDLRPLHSDEGGNYWFIKEVLERGIYPYSHENYHGPLFFYAAAVPVIWFGYTAVTIRLFAALCGALIPVIPLLLLKDLGRRTVLAAAALLAVSPSLVFYSRYSIHEIPFVLAGLFFMAVFYRWLAEGYRRDLYLAAASAVVLIALKETFVFTGVGALIAALLTFKPADLIDLVKKQRREIGYAIFAGVIGVIFIYTGGGRWTKGIIELLSALPQWFGRGTSVDVGHFKSWNYYLIKLFAAIEPAVLPGLTISLLAIVWNCLVRSRLKATVLPEEKIKYFRCWRYLLIFSLIQFLIYSSIPYKTPWLVVNLSAPALLCLACLLGWASARSAILAGLAAAFVLLPILGFSVFQTAGYCFRPGDPWNHMGYVPYGEENPYSYVHTADGMLQMVEVIADYKRLHPDAKILVGVSGYWPLPFYLRRYDKDTSYLVTNDPAAQAKENSVIVAEGDVAWRDPNYSDEFFKLSDFQTARLFLRKEQQP